MGPKLRSVLAPDDKPIERRQRARALPKAPQGPIAGVVQGILILGDTDVAPQIPSADVYGTFERFEFRV